MKRLILISLLFIGSHQPESLEIEADGVRYKETANEFTILPQ